MAHPDAGEQFWVPLLAVPGESFCPVAALGGLLEVAKGLPANTPLFFVEERVGGVGKRVFPLTMRAAREWLAFCLRVLGAGHLGLTFHSFRRGACSLAFAAGAETGDLKQHGGWRSDTVRGYFPAVEARRRVARRLVSPFVTEQMLTFCGMNGLPGLVYVLLVNGNDERRGECIGYIVAKLWILCINSVDVLVAGMKYCRVTAYIQQ